MALAAVGGGVGGAGKLGVGGTGLGSVALRQAVASVVTQGVGVATGLQKNFSWAGVAAAAIGSMIPGKLGPMGTGSIAARTIANAATRTLIEGSDFEDNIRAALPDVIGSTIGEAIAERANEGIAEYQEERARQKADARYKAQLAAAIGRTADDIVGEVLAKLPVTDELASSAKQEWSDVITEADEPTILDRMRAAAKVQGHGIDTAQVAPDEFVKLQRAEQERVAKARELARNGPQLRPTDGSEYGLFGRLGPFKGYYDRVDDAYDHRDAAYATISNADLLSLGGWGDLGGGALGVVGSYAEWLSSVVTGPLDIIGSLSHGHGFNPTPSDKWATDVTFTLGSFYAGGIGFAGRAGIAESAVPSQLRAGIAYEAERLQQLGLSKNTTVWRPSQTDIDSAAFNVIVGPVEYTPGGLPVGTIFDVTRPGLLELKSGTSVLNSSYQSRLQTYYALKNDLPFSIDTTRPVNPTFQDWLTRWSVTVK